MSTICWLVSSISSEIVLDPSDYFREGHQLHNGQPSSRRGRVRTRQSAVLPPSARPIQHRWDEREQLEARQTVSSAATILFLDGSPEGREIHEIWNFSVKLEFEWIVPEYGSPPPIFEDWKKKRENSTPSIFYLVVMRICNVPENLWIFQFADQPYYTDHLYNTI